MKEKILAYIKEHLLDTDEAISASDDLLTSGLLDSMAVMNLITFVEEVAKISIPPEDMVIEHFVNVEAIVSYLEEQHLSALV